MERKEREKRKGSSRDKFCMHVHDTQWDHLSINHRNAIYKGMNRISTDGWIQWLEIIGRSYGRLARFSDNNLNTVLLCSIIDSSAVLHLSFAFVDLKRK